MAMPVFEPEVTKASACDHVPPAMTSRLNQQKIREDHYVQNAMAIA